MLRSVVSMLLLACCIDALRVPSPRLSRADALRSAVGLAGAALSAPLVSNAGGVPEGMKTSESYSNLQQISPETTGTLGAGTMSSRSRPATGVVLLEEVQESGKKDTPTVSADIVLDGGVVATATFQSSPGYPLIRGMFYDVEVKGKAGDSAFMQVAALPEGKTISDMTDKFFTKAVFSTEGRFGAYGAATDIRVLKSDIEKNLRMFEVTFSALSPGGAEAPRHAIVSALQPEGATDVVMLVSSSTSGVWKKNEPALRAMASSLRIASVRPTSIKRKSKSDYRFEDQGGLNERTTDSVINLGDF